MPRVLALALRDITSMALNGFDLFKNQNSERIEQCSCKVVIKREKFKAVSNPVWVCWKAMI